MNKAPTHDTLLYCNQPIFRYKDQYFANHVNFVDFLAHWASSEQKTKLFVPVTPVTNRVSDGVLLNLKKETVVEVRAYRSHLGAFLAGIYNFGVFWRHAKMSMKVSGVKPWLIIPGPNTFSTVLSFTYLTKMKVGVIVRGDGLRTLSNMYQNSVVRPIVLALFKFYRKRITGMQKHGAKLFCLGDRLTEFYSNFGSASEICPLISVINHGVDSVAPKPESGCVRILFIGRLSREKGVEELIAAARNLNESGHRFKLTIAGHGPLEQQVVDLVDSQAAGQGQVAYLGRLAPGAAVLDHMRQADWLVLPSKTEGIPRVIVEAQSVGLAVIATKVGGIPGAFADSIAYFDDTSLSSIQLGLSNILDGKLTRPKFDPKALSKFEFEYNKKEILLEMNRDAVVVEGAD